MAEMRVMAIFLEGWVHSISCVIYSYIVVLSCHVQLITVLYIQLQLTSAYHPLFCVTSQILKPFLLYQVFFHACCNQLSQGSIVYRPTPTLCQMCSVFVGLIVQPTTMKLDPIPAENSFPSQLLSATARMTSYLLSWTISLAR